MSNNNENALVSVQADTDVAITEEMTSSQARHQAQAQAQEQEVVVVVPADTAPRATVEETSSAIRSRWLSICRKIIPAYRCRFAGCYPLTTRRDLREHRRRAHPQPTNICVSRSTTRTYSYIE